MKTTNANAIRTAYLEKLMSLLAETEEIMKISTGSVAFPVVAEDGEEGWVEIAVKIPKWTEDDDGYAKAEEYRIVSAEREERAKAKAQEKAKKIADAKAKKEAKAKEKAERAEKVEKVEKGDEE